MIPQNPSLNKLSENYLFLEVRKRKEAFVNRNPDSNLISLGIGDTPRPLTHTAIRALMEASVDQGCIDTYVGYGPEQGILPLRKQIAELFYPSSISEEEIFISDGAKCDTARLQLLFGPNHPVAIQDPTYPVYLDGSLLQGVKHLIYMPCTQENSFFVDATNLPQHSLIYICSPNNPTGVAYNYDQLKTLVDIAKEKESLILFDAAYSAFIQSDDYPKSIYEVEGADEVAIELNSFSKLAGFTGVRLGWSVVPKKLKYKEGSSIHADWLRVVSTTFNGASILSQKAALGVLSPKGMQESQGNIGLYLNNAAQLKKCFEQKGLDVFGGTNSPYLWIQFPNLNSWEAFDYLLEKAHVICTPGSGFGPSGEGYIRLSAFAHEQDVATAIKRFEQVLTIKKNALL